MPRVVRLVCAGLLLLPSAASASVGGVGETVWLGGMGSARWLAMGRAGAADGENVLGLAVNPALLHDLDATRFEALYASLGDRVSIASLAAGHSLGRFGTAAVALGRLGSSGMTAYDGAGLKAGTYGASEMRFGFGYAYSPFRDFAAGLSLRGIRKQVSSLSDVAVAGDFGVRYRVNRTFAFALSTVDLLSPRFDLAGGERAPLHLRVGGNAAAFRGRLLANVDVETIGTDGGPRSLRWHVGLEGELAEWVRVRAGAESVGLSAGFGLRFPVLSVDYAIVSTRIGPQHWVGLHYSMTKDGHGRGAAPPREARPERVPARSAERVEGPRPAPAKPVEIRAPKPAVPPPTAAPTAAAPLAPTQAAPDPIAMAALAESLAAEAKRRAVAEQAASQAAPAPSAPLVIPSAPPPAPSAAAPFAAPIVLARPLKLRSVRAGTSVSIEWDPVAGASAYAVATAALPWDPPKSAGAPVTQAKIVLSIPAGSSLFVTVRAISAAGAEGPLSDIFEAK